MNKLFNHALGFVLIGAQKHFPLKYVNNTGGISAEIMYSSERTFCPIFVFLQLQYCAKVLGKCENNTVKKNALRNMFIRINVYNAK